MFDKCDDGKKINNKIIIIIIKPYRMCCCHVCECIETIVLVYGFISHSVLSWIACWTFVRWYVCLCVLIVSYMYSVCLFLGVLFRFIWRFTWIVFWNSTVKDLQLNRRLTLLYHYNSIWSECGVTKASYRFCAYCWILKNKVSEVVYCK